MTNMPFHNWIQSFVEKVEYNWPEKYGQIWAGGPVDMTGTIRLFSLIDPEVNVILAYLDDIPDVCYRKKKGKWEVGGLRVSKPEYDEVRKIMTERGIAYPEALKEVRDGR